MAHRGASVIFRWLHRLCDHLRTTQTRWFTFLHVPSAGRTDKTCGQALGNRGKYLHDSCCQLTFRAVEMCTFRLLTICSDPEDFPWFGRRGECDNLFGERNGLVQVANSGHVIVVESDNAD